jgi:hypothetical protein
VRVAERFEEVKGYEQIGLAGRDQGAELPANPDMALNRSPALRHTMCFRTFDMPVLDQAGFTKDIGGKDGPLTPDSDDEDIVTAGHFFPSRTIAPTGQSCTQTEHPLQSSLILAFSSENSIAGQPNRTQVPQPVQASVSTSYLLRFTPARRADITHICRAITTLTPLRFFASWSTFTIPVIS